MIKVLIGKQKTYDGRYKYTDADLNELQILTDSIRSIHQVMKRYALDSESDDEFSSNIVGVFSALEILIDPIVTFFVNRQPLAKEDGQAEEAA
jgi:hypothetical protein